MVGPKFQDKIIEVLSIDNNLKNLENKNLIFATRNGFVKRTKINLYRIIQECLQIINKYANAVTFSVKLKKEENNLILEIIDDGIGFNINKAKKGIGLQNIRSRTQECNGTVEINSKMGEGTIIKVAIALG